MNKVVDMPKRKLTEVDAMDALDTKLREIGNIADLIAAANSDCIEVDDLNVTGYMMERMVQDAAELAKKLHKLGGAS